MFTGLFIIQAYKQFSITRPIAALPLLITISAVLCLAAYVRDRVFSAADSLELRAIITSRPHPVFDPLCEYLWNLHEEPH